LVGFEGGVLEYYEDNINKEYELFWSNQINNNFLDIEAGEVSGSGYREFIVSS